MITIVIPFCPVSWKAHAGYGRRSFNPRYKEIAAYKDEIRSQYFGDIIGEPVEIEYIFQLPIPSSTSKNNLRKIETGELKHVKRPDCSNLVKLCEDTLKGIVIKDDSQVVRFTARKIYSAFPKTVIKIYTCII